MRRVVRCESTIDLDATSHELKKVVWIDTGLYYTCPKCRGVVVTAPCKVGNIGELKEVMQGVEGDDKGKGKGKADVDKDEGGDEEEWGDDMGTGPEEWRKFFI